MSFLRHGSLVAVAVSIGLSSCTSPGVPSDDGGRSTEAAGEASSEDETLDDSDVESSGRPPATEDSTGRTTTNGTTTGSTSDHGVTGLLDPTTTTSAMPTTDTGTADSTSGSTGETGADTDADTGAETETGADTAGNPNTCPETTPLTGGTQYCSNSRGNAGSGYTYELWAEGGGSGCMTVHGDGRAFSATWNDVEDFLARVGLSFDQTRTHAQIGTFSAEFAETKTDDGGLTYIGIYGWTVNPLREFYIIEDWGSAEKPGGFSSDGTPRDEVGTLVADGETYDVWKKTRVDKPAITGPSETFDQYFSIRRTARQCGTISVSEHFRQWEELGLPLGNLHEVMILLEAQFNSGSISLTTANVSVN